MRPILHPIFWSTVAACLAGCGGLPSGQSGVKVLIKAEPKAGYTMDVKAADVYAARPDMEDATTAKRDPFRPLDYRNLADIVVYLVPDGGSAAAAPVPKPMVIDAAPGSSAARWRVAVSAVGGELRVENSSASPRAVYLRTEAGVLSDVGEIPPRGSLSATLSVPGAITVWAESGKPEDDRLGEVFVAPNGWVAVGVSGGSATFAPCPPGNYTLHTWHPRLPGQSQKLTLTPDRYIETTAVVTVNVLPPAK